MKTNLFITLFLLFFSGYDRQEPIQLTQQEQETAKKEIKEVVKVIFSSLEKMDVETLFQSYSNSSNFILLTTDASMEDYQEAKNEHAKWFKTLSSLKVTPVNYDFRFLAGKFVIYSWLGKFEITLKSGVQLKMEKFAITFIFNKIDNNWKVIYQHSSASPPVKQVPMK